MSELAGSSITENQKLSLKALKREVGSACNRARPVTGIDPETGLCIEFLADALAENERITNNKELTFTLERYPGCVYVDNAHEYPVLVGLALRQLLKVNHHLSEKELNSEIYRQYYIEWYTQNLKHHTEHELQHYFGAKEHTTLNCFLGVEFFINPNGEYNFRPIIGFEGSVASEVYRKFVAEGPKELSKADQVIVGKNL